MYLKIGHNPELVDLFPVELVEELIGGMLDILRGSDRTADHENVSTGLEGVLHNIHAYAAGRCNEQLAAGRLLDGRDVAPGMSGLLDIDCPVEFHDVRLDFQA